MKWFKHDSDANMDAKLGKLSARYGLQGYGLYWYCLEMIAMNVQKHNLTFELEHDAELLSRKWDVHQDQIQEMMTYMVDLNLFDCSNGIVRCLKMATRTDEYTQKLIKGGGVVGTLSGQTTTNSALIEEKRREQKEKNIKKRIPKDFSISPRVRDWAKEKGHNNLDVHYENFKLAAEAKGYQYVDWDKAFMGAIRSNWAKVEADQYDPLENYV